ncbi:hypothetical protein FBZ87_12121 [Nitrospirillum amazonense]|uniref:Uncharacterized protein n=1 Tax=Nitrospirillum amazonense TaxID=28077 RepID=A0A560J2X8_9PROT|nr:hypothetical protein [Nitrospirillum amazonense]TWB65603.1 hypothetical protein FBZ87_12121 [Nitrospirillum amazonense]
MGVSTISSAAPRPTWRRPSTGYYLTLGLALPGIVFAATSIAASLQIRAHADPFDILNPVGLPALLFVWFLLYAFRLIFWGKMPAQMQNLVRTLLTLVLCLEVLAGLAAFILVWNLPTEDLVRGQAGFIMVEWFTTIAVLSQIATVIWLLRYRKE